MVIYYNNKNNNSKPLQPLEGLVYRPPSDPTSTCPQIQVENHRGSLGVRCDIHVDFLHPLLASQTIITATNQQLPNFLKVMCSYGPDCRESNTGSLLVREWLFHFVMAADSYISIFTALITSFETTEKAFFNLSHIVSCLPLLHFSTLQ